MTAWGQCWAERQRNITNHDFLFASYSVCLYYLCTTVLNYHYTNCTEEVEGEIMKLTFLNRLLSSTSMFSVLQESTFINAAGFSWLSELSDA